MNSCLYECRVMHHRLTPKVHQFRYRIFMMQLDLDELDGLAARLPFFSRNRWNLFAFRDADHLGAGNLPIKEKLLAYLAEHDLTLPPGATVTLLTLPRVLGYIFNPVSFYFCHDPLGAPLCAVVEVGNTFREKKLYLLPQSDAEGRFCRNTPKEFYVSPFSALDLHFAFKLRCPSSKLEIHIDELAGSEVHLRSTLSGERATLTSARLLWFAFKYPFITLQVIAAIHWQALLLWLKRVPFYAKAARPDLQRGVLHPHVSLQAKTV